MKRFIITNLLALAALPMMACVWIETHNWYLFHAYDTASDDFSDRVDRISRSNWKTYLGLADSDYFWFDADRIIEAAKAKGDDLMASYVTYLQKYVEVCSDISGDRWNYPSKEELAERNRTVTNIRLYASSKLKTRLRSQHALLFMRCNMLLGRHDENVTFWEQTASQYIETVYKDMMKNIYAGALSHTGREAEAGTIFMEQGDYESLMTQYYQLRSFEAIQREYNRDPNSAVLPFLLQDFVNNAQEAVDNDSENEGEAAGKLFVRDIEHAEALQMIGLADRAVANNATRNPVLWQSAKAWLEYLFGDAQQAASDIAAAVLMDGTDRQKLNARLLRFYIYAATKPFNADYDKFIADELKWMYVEAANDDNNAGRKDSETTLVGTPFYCVVDRTVNQVLTDKYFGAGRTNEGLALLCATSASEYHSRLYGMDVDNIKAYRDYLKQPATTPLDEFLKARALVEESELNDLIGTKYMQLYKWNEAITWLEQVPVEYYAQQGIAPYAVLRKWNVEPWVTRQWVRDSQLWGDEKPTLTFNPKLAFAREMQAKETGLNLLKGEFRLQRCYDLAVRYAQVDVSGDLWFIMNESKDLSEIETWDDEDKRSERPLALKAVSLLQEAAKSRDFHLRERALFAQAYIYLNPDNWKNREWDHDAREYNWIPMPETQQYRAFAALADFERQHEGQISDYVSNCDEFKQFMKHYK